MENSIGENVNFFHLGCLSSGLALNVDFDVTTTVLASLLYRMLASKLSGFEFCGPKLLFRKFILSKHVNVKYFSQCRGKVISQ